jgi:prepilin-type N-terminal cleavage/methylation domain-containing protein
MTASRKGFTLVELLMVTVLGSLVLLSAMQVLITNRRTYTAQSAVIAGQQATRMAVEVLFAELREVSPSGGDILAMDDDSIRVRLMRKFSYICDTDWSGQPTVTVVKNVSFSGGDSLMVMGGANRFTPGDSVFVFADNDEAIDSDDAWISASITAMDSTDVFCPIDSIPAIQLTFQGQGALFDADSVGIGAPVRSFSAYSFGTTTMNGDVYLARRDSGDYIPVTGPLADTDGLEFRYLDRFGSVTATATQVAQIEVVVRTGSEVLNSLGQMVSDSIRVPIFTRN